MKILSNLEEINFPSFNFFPTPPLHGGQTSQRINVKSSGLDRLLGICSLCKRSNDSDTRYPLIPCGRYTVTLVACTHQSDAVVGGKRGELRQGRADDNSDEFDGHRHPQPFVDDGL